MWYKHCQASFVMYYQSLGSQPTVTRFLKWFFFLIKTHCTRIHTTMGH